MIPLKRGIQSMAHMNLSTKQTQTHRHREQTRGCQGAEGWERDGVRVWG